MARLDLWDPSPTAKCDFLLRKGTCRLSLWDELEEAEGEPCRRRQHPLTICLRPEEKSSSGQLHVHQTQLCAPGEAEDLEACGPNSCWSLWGSLSNPQAQEEPYLPASVGEESLTDVSYLFCSDPNSWLCFNSYDIQNEVSFCIVKS